MGFIDTEEYRHAQNLLRQKESGQSGPQPRKKARRPWDADEPKIVRGGQAPKKAFNIKGSVEKLRINRRAIQELFGFY